jgi:hypothetical protein
MDNVTMKRFSSENFGPPMPVTIARTHTHTHIHMHTHLPVLLDKEAESVRVIQMGITVHIQVVVTIHSQTVTTATSKKESDLVQLCSS